MEDYSKIIDSLYVKFRDISHLEIIKPVSIEDQHDLHNLLILVNRGCVTFGEDNVEVNEGELLFIPSGKTTSLKYGTGNAITIEKSKLSASMSKHFKSKDVNPVLENIIILRFDAKVFESVNFFLSTDIPPFKIENANMLISGVRELAHEDKMSIAGKGKMIKINTDRIVINIIRHILENKMFTKQLATNVNYFKDPRLLDIFTYIKKNLKNDLSNKTLANIANVSEDYVGQYFKMLTGTNPQDYIEFQRMERAVELIKTTKKTVNEITVEVGYKGSAYFCRRFKLMFGVSTGQMRKKDALSDY